MIFLQKTFFVAALVFVSCAFLQAQETGGAKGKIKNSQDRGIEGVSVKVEQNGKTVRSSQTDKNGSFLIEGLKSGKYNFTFSKNGFATGTLNNVEVGGKKVRDIGNRLLEIDEGTLVFVNGTVFNQDGKSIYGAKVEIEKISVGSSKKIKPDYTSVGGEFSFRFPDETAKYRVTASFKGKSATKEVEVEGAAIYRVALTINSEEIETAEDKKP